MKGKDMKYISDGTWFKEGTECKLIEDYRDGNYNGGLFEGIFVIEDEESRQIKEKWKDNKVGDEVIDREVCNFDEFKHRYEIRDGGYIYSR